MKGNRKPFLIGVTGGTASGKTSVCELIMEQMGVRYCSLISMDSFYRPLTAEDRAHVSSYNFDHPNALDFDLINDCLRNILLGSDVKIPIYDFKLHSRVGEQIVPFAPVIIFEGILAFYDERVRALMDFKIFVNTDDDVRLARRLVRDINERGRTITSVLVQYNQHVKKAYDDFIYPTMKYANIILPQSERNKEGINFVIENIKLKLKEMGIRITPSHPACSFSPAEIIQAGSLKFRDLRLPSDDFPVLNEVLLKLLAAEHHMSNKPFLAYLAHQLLPLAIPGGRCEKSKLSLIPIPIHSANEGTSPRNQLEAALKDHKKVLLFCHALLKKQTLDQLNSCVEAAKGSDKPDISVICFFTTPAMLAKVLNPELLTMCVVYCDVSLKAQRQNLLNDHPELPHPISADYEKSILDALHCFTI